MYANGGECSLYNIVSKFFNLSDSSDINYVKNVEKRLGIVIACKQIIVTSTENSSFALLNSAKSLNSLNFVFFFKGLFQLRKAVISFRMVNF